jgi:hypothetical protein
MGIVDTLIPAAVGLAGVLLGSWLTAKRSSREKLIDLRRESYGRILSDLWEVERLCDIANEYISETGGENYFSSESDRKSDEKIYTYVQSIRKRFTDDYLIISDEFRSLYEAMNDETASSSDDHLDPEDQHDHFDSVVRKHRQLLLTQARKETMTRNQRFFFG